MFALALSCYFCRSTSDSRCTNVMSSLDVALCELTPSLRESNIRAQDYKEKHKLDSKQISDSAFGAHLSFCEK